MVSPDSHLIDGGHFGSSLESELGESSVVVESCHCSDKGFSHIWGEPRVLVVWGAAGGAVVFKRAAVGFVLAEDAAEVSFLRWGYMCRTVRSLGTRQ